MKLFGVNKSAVSSEATSHGCCDAAPGKRRCKQKKQKNEEKLSGITFDRTSRNYSCSHDFPACCGNTWGHGEKPSAHVSWMLAASEFVPQVFLYFATAQ